MGAECMCGCAPHVKNLTFGRPHKGYTKKRVPGTCSAESGRIPRNPLLFCFRRPTDSMTNKRAHGQVPRWSHTWPNFLVEQRGAGSLPEESNNCTRLFAYSNNLRLWEAMLLFSVPGHQPVTTQDAWPTSPKMAPNPFDKIPENTFAG